MWHRGYHTIILVVLVEEYQAHEEETVSNALYSASVDDRDTVGCFLELHEIKFGPKKRAYPPMERRSSALPAQLASVKTLSNVEGDFLICSHYKKPFIL